MQVSSTLSENRNINSLVYLNVSSQRIGGSFIGRLIPIVYTKLNTSSLWYIPQVEVQRKYSPHIPGVLDVGGMLQNTSSCYS